MRVTSGASPTINVYPVDSVVTASHSAATAPTNSSAVCVLDILRK